MTAPDGEPTAAAGASTGTPSAFRTVVVTAASNLTLPLSALVTSPILARALGPEGRGIFAAVMAPIAFATLFSTVGVPESLVYTVASRRLARLQAAVTGALIGLVTGTLAAVAVWFLAPLLLVRSPEYVGLLRSLALTLPVLLAAAALRGGVQGSNDFRTVNRERWLSVGSRVLLIVVFALAGWLTVSSAVWLTNGTAVVATLVLGWAVLRWRRTPSATGAREGPRAGWRPSRPGATMLLGYGSRVWLGSISVLVIIRADQVVMAPVVSATQLGFYAVAVAVAEVPTAAFGALRDVMFARSASLGDSTAIALASRLSVVAFVPVGVVGVLLMAPAVSLVFGADFAGATPVAQVLLVATLPSGLALVAGSGLLSIGRPGLLSAAQAVTATLSVILTLALAPTYGALGAALASAGSYVALLAVTVGLFSRGAGVPVRTLLVPQRGDVALLRAAARR